MTNPLLHRFIFKANEFLALFRGLCIEGLATLLQNRAHVNARTNIYHKEKRLSSILPHITRDENERPSRLEMLVPKEEFLEKVEVGFRNFYSLK